MNRTKGRYDKEEMYKERNDWGAETWAKSHVWETSLVRVC